MLAGTGRLENGEDLGPGLIKREWEGYARGKGDFSRYGREYIHGNIIWEYIYGRQGIYCRGNQEMCASTCGEGGGC
jgi:hypothetical protein